MPAIGTGRKDTKMAELNIGTDRNGQIVIGRLMDEDTIMPIIVFPTLTRAKQFAENMLDYITDKEFPVPEVYLDAFEEDMDEY